MCVYIYTYKNTYGNVVYCYKHTRRKGIKNETRVENSGKTGLNWDFVRQQYHEWCPNAKNDTR